jgi:hypothetical protein
MKSAVVSTPTTVSTMTAASFQNCGRKQEH